MRLSFWYWLLVGIWHLGLVGLAYYVLAEDHYAWFLGAQGIAVISLWLAYRLYRALVAPLVLIEGGKSALLDQDFSVKYRHTGSPELDGLVDIYNQMIDSLRDERVKTESQHYFLQKLITASPSGILVLDYDGVVVNANPAIQSLLAYDPIGQAVAEAEHPLLQLSHRLAIGESDTLKLGATDHYRIEVSAFVDRGFERKFVQVQGVSQEVLAAEKRAYGQVIRMMAHEVNNSIGAVNALLQSFAEEDDTSDPNWVADVKEGLPIAIKRNDQLNYFMRNFAEVVRLPQPHLNKTDVGALLTHCSTLMSATAQKQDTVIQVDLPDYPVWAMLDEQQLEQAIINVIQNALESLGQGGQIKVRYLVEAQQIVIADNGPGLTEAAADQLFTPFFSTKPQGQGVGLTLVRDILTNHQFRFELRTHADGWTRFAITLGVG